MPVAVQGVELDVSWLLQSVPRDVVPEGEPKEERGVQSSKGDQSNQKRPRTKYGATYRLGTLGHRTLNTSRERGLGGTFAWEAVRDAGGKTRAHRLGGDV